MNLEYMIGQCTADSARWFPGSQTPDFLTLCVAGEVGEVANLVKKVVRGTLTMQEAIEYPHNLPEEIIDVLIYLCNLMGLSEFENVDWEGIWEAKRQINEDRFGKLNLPNATVFPYTTPANPPRVTPESAGS